jgi:ribosomal subunit interface protein
MEILVQGRNFEVNDRVREYIAKKAQRLERHLPSIDTVRVEFTEEGTRSQQDRILARVTVSVNNGASTIAGEERGPNAFTVIDTLMDSLDRRVVRHKGKTYRSEQAKKGRDVSPRFKEPPEEEG